MYSRCYRIYQPFIQSNPTCRNMDVLPKEGDGLGYLIPHRERNGKEEDWIPGGKSAEVSWWVMHKSQYKERFQPTLSHLISWIYYISIPSHKHITLWHLTDLFAQGNVKIPQRLLKPPPCIIHIHRPSFCWHASPWPCVEDFCKDFVWGALWDVAGRYSVI